MWALGTSTILLTFALPLGRSSAMWSCARGANSRWDLLTSFKCHLFWNPCWHTHGYTACLPAPLWWLFWGFPGLLVVPVFLLISHECCWSRHSRSESAPVPDSLGLSAGSWKSSSFSLCQGRDIIPGVLVLATLGADNKLHCHPRAKVPPAFFLSFGYWHQLP